MKQFFWGLFIALLLGVIAFLIFRSCQDKPEITNERETELIKEIDSLKCQLVTSMAERDSLLKLPTKIKIKTITEIKYIDSLIKKDSTYAITEYRRGLQLWNYLPDGSDLLTYREAGLGAKIFQEGYGFKLQVTEYENIVKQDDKIISNLKFQIEGQKDLIKIKENNIEYYKGLYEDESAWYNENWIWLTLGVVITGGAVALIGATN